MAKHQTERQPPLSAPLTAVYVAFLPKESSKSNAWPYPGNVPGTHDSPSFSPHTTIASQADTARHADTRFAYPCDCAVSSAGVAPGVRMRMSSSVMWIFRPSAANRLKVVISASLLGTPLPSELI